MRLPFAPVSALSRRRLFSACWTLAWFITATGQAATVKAPDWVTGAAGQKSTLAYGDAAEAFLVDDAVIDIDRAGVFTTRTRRAVRVLTADGKKLAVERIGFNAGSEKVKSVEGWLLPRTGPVIGYGRKQAIETAVFDGARELYGEAKQIIVSAVEDAEPGAVFAVESVVEEKSIDTQFVWYFQGGYPVEQSAITINLPDGWTVEAHTFNHAPIEPVVHGHSYRWELTQLPHREDEPWAPSGSSLDAWVALDIRPPAGAANIRRQSFSSWRGLSEYFTPRYEQASATDPALTAKAASLTAGATSRWERIQRLCQYAQQVNYISILLNSAEAGGWSPRPATSVLKCNYGDCKDKTTLLRALLRSQGIESHALVLYSGDATHVRPEWPSPWQFNHCITTISLAEGDPDTGATYTHPVLGRMLIFDPTNEFVPPGWLGEEDCGGHALLLAGDRGELITLPVLRADQNRYSRQIKAQLKSNGYISGTIEEEFTGQSSVDIRDEYQGSSPSAYANLVQRWLGHSLPSAHASRVEAKNRLSEAAFDLSVDFEAYTYGKVMRDDLLVFKPVIVARRSATTLKRGPRTQPVEIRPVSFSEHTAIELPADCVVDEAYPGIKLDTPFGRYQASAAIKGNQLEFERMLELDGATVPAADYEKVRTFFEKITQAEQTPVVLKRVPKT